MAGAVGDEGAARPRRRHREGGVVGGQISARRASGWRPRAWRSRPAPAPWAAGPEGAEGPLRAAARLGRIGRDMPDAELRQGPARPACAPSWRPARRPWGCGNNGCPGRYRARRTGRAASITSPSPRKLDAVPFLLDQKGRVDRARRIVERHHQIVLPLDRPAARHSARHPGAASCRPAAGAAASCDAPSAAAPASPARPLQRQPGHRVAQLVAVPLHQLLVEMLHREPA